jgi:voltage-gated potassium channel
VAGDSEKQRDASLETVFYHTERVPFVHWQEFSDAKTSVLVTGAVAVLSFVTGLSNLSGETVALEGPVAALVPQVAPVARFAGVVFAFLLGGITVGLQSRKRLAWYAAVAVLPLVALLPLTTLQRTDLPLLVLVVLAVPLLVANRGTFDQRIDLSSLQIAALSAVGGVFVYGTIGSYALRSQFGELATWSDAVYYVIITIATVGYGDITPLTAESKWFSLSVVLLGTGAFTAAIGSLVVPAIESRMAAAFGNMTPSELTLLDDHVLILGYSDITDSLLDELAGETDVVVVTGDAGEAADLNDRDVNVLTDDPTDEAALRDARIEDASGVVVATRDDAQDVLAILAAKTANPEVRIVAAANEDKNVSKLREVGADEVISPTVIGGRILGQSVLGERPASALFDGSDDGEDGGDGTADPADED